MGIFRQHVIPMIITCMLQGTLCDTGIPRTFYGGNICSVCTRCLNTTKALVWSKKLRRHIATAVSEQGSLGQTLVWSNYVKNNNLAEKLNHSETMNMYLQQHSEKRNVSN